MSSIGTNINLTQTYVDNATWPITMTGAGTTLTFTENITINDSLMYIIIGANNITINGNNYTLTVYVVDGYQGFAGNASYTNFIIKNLSVTSETSTDAFGWICRSSTTNATITNCSASTGVRSSYGGIVGTITNSTISNCYFTGDINENGGGIIGSNCSNVTITNCYASGPMLGLYAGGICGILNNNCTITNCYYLNDIYEFCGGISGVSLSNSTITNCFSIGAISADGAGICANNADNVTVSDSYSIGNVGTNGGGIFGAACSGCSAINCYTRGSILSSGGIYGYQNTNCIAVNCYSTGNCTSYGSGSGIFGSSNETCIISHCYCSGANASLANDTNIDMTITNSYAEYPSSGWSNTNANNVLNDTWLSNTSNQPYLLSSFDAELYSPNSYTRDDNESYSSPNGLYQNSNQYYIYDSSVRTISNITINSTTGSITFGNLSNGIYTVTVVTGNVLNSIYYNYNTNIFTLYQSIPTPPICFDENTIIKTDQEFVKIKNINKHIHTIDNLQIIKVIKTVPTINYLYCIPPHTFDYNIPNKLTILSPEHKIFYNNKFIKISDIHNKHIYKIIYNKKKPIYNILLEQYHHIYANNLLCETLNHNTTIAKIYLNYSDPSQLYHLINDMNKKIINKKNKKLIY